MANDKAGGIANDVKTILAAMRKTDRQTADDQFDSRAY
jgi:hypothetical protein